MAGKQERSTLEYNQSWRRRSVLETCGGRRLGAAMLHQVRQSSRGSNLWGDERLKWATTARGEGVIKEYCDCCGKQITKKSAAAGGTVYCPDRLGTEITKGGASLRVEIITFMNGTANGGHFCKYCILDALYKLDDRPKLKAVA